MMTEADVFQQIQPIESMEHVKNCLQMAMLSLFGGNIPGCGCFGVIGMKEGSKRV